MFFSVVGNEQAAQFFTVDRINGNIRLKTSLLQDPAASEQYQVWEVTMMYKVHKM